MALSKHRVQFMFDVVSPYTYLAYRVLKRYESLWNLDIEWQPMLLAGVMKGSANRPPGMVANKARFMGPDLRRNQQMFDVPVRNVPSNFFEVAADLRMMRVLCCAKETQPKEVALAMNDLAFEHYWGTLRTVPEAITVDDEVISNIATEAGVENAKAFLEAAYSSQNKKRLAEVTNDAVERGAFGAPSIFVQKKGSDETTMFFGSDRFEQMAFFLGETWHGPRGPKAAL